MSRIGKKPISIPEKTEVTVSGNVITIKGPVGTLSREFSPDLNVVVNGKEINITAKKETIESKVNWGTTASHVKSMLAGVNKHFEKKLILEGVGYKSDVKGAEIVLSLGFSHQVKVAIPKDLKVTADKNLISVSGASKELVGGFAAKLRGLKKAEPYKGKGMRYDDEVIRRKEGKKTV